MPGAARLGDKAQTSSDAHGCPACPHPAIGPIVQGSRDVFINQRPAARMDDPGVHSSCCGPNTFTIARGSPTVYVNGKPLARMNDRTKHCGGTGPITEGSPDVMIDDGAAAATGLAAYTTRRGAAAAAQPAAALSFLEISRFRAHRGRTTLQVKLIDGAGNALANKACTLEYEGDSYSVKSDGSGVLNESVPPHLSEARLIVDGVSMTLAIGQLNPMDQVDDGGVSGVQGRLSNLGYYRGAVDGRASDETRAAGLAFRRANGLPESEDVDQTLIDALRNQHGS